MTEVRIFDRTELYKKYNLKKHIEKGLQYVPSEHLKNIFQINIYDDGPNEFPISIQGGYYPPDNERGTIISIYVDPTTRYMLCTHDKTNAITYLFDKIFILTFGKLFLVGTLFHEIGHHVFDLDELNRSKSKEEAEVFANSYDLKIYGQMHPMKLVLYNAFNGIYHFVYRSRIRKAKDIEDKRSKCGLTTG